jgi:hypothetical protein
MFINDLFNDDDKLNESLKGMTASLKHSLRSPSLDAKKPAKKDTFGLTGELAENFDDEDYDDEESADEGFFVAIGSEDEGAFVGMINKDGGKWRETAISGNAPYNWGSTYMSYLTPDDVMQHIRNDYGRHAQVKGPFASEESAMQYAQSHFDLGSDVKFGDEDYDVHEATGDDRFDKMMGGITSPDALNAREAVAMMLDLVYHGGASYKEALHQASQSFDIDPVKLHALYKKSGAGDDEQLHELSNQKLGQYKKAAAADASAADARGDYAHGDKRFKGIVKATIKQGENDSKKNINELGKDTLKRYAKANVDDRMLRATGDSFRSGKANDPYNDAPYDTPYDKKRERGFDRALNKLSKGVAEDRENYNGVNLLLQKDDDELFVKASAGGRELGHVLFVIDGEYLMPQDLEVEERYRGQGIAQTMYDYVKSKGYKIRRSGQQTDAGAGFWDKHKGQGQNVWEQGVAEGNLKEFAPVGGDDREPNEEEILRQLAAQWWNGTEQQMAKAQNTLAAMGWEIGPDESGDDDAGVFVIRAGDVNGNSYMAFNHSDLYLNEGVAEEWSKKYKSSINCSHPKGFSQKAHCAGKKKHNESHEVMEMVCEDCGMCQTHGSLTEIAKGAKDANGVTKCWPGKHAEGTKKGRNGGQVRNCVPNESVEEEAKHGLYYNVNKRKKAGTSRPASSPKAPTAQAWKDAAKTESVAESGRPDDYRGLKHELAHERNNIEISINGRVWKIFPGEGTDGSPEFFRQKQRVADMCNRKTEATGKKWTWGVTGAPATNESVKTNHFRQAEPAKPRNFVAKNATIGGAGKHVDKKKEAKQGIEKHKKPVELDEDYELLQAVAESMERSGYEFTEAANAAQQAAIAINMKKNHKKPKNEDMSRRGFLKGMGAMAAGAALGSAAHAQSIERGEDFLPDIVANVTFKVNGQTISKKINLGTQYTSPGEASAALEKFLKSKGIRYYEYSLERVKPGDDQEDYLDKTPATNANGSGSIDNRPYQAVGSKDSDYMAKESIDEAIDNYLLDLADAGYDIVFEGTQP